MDTDVGDIPIIVEELRDIFLSGQTLSVDSRIDGLNRLCKMLEENRKLFEEALTKDLKSIPVLLDYEVSGPLKDAKNAISNLTSWMKPQSVSLPLSALPGSGYRTPEPYGVVLIISPWNYPLSLLFKPLVGALAAGNAAVIKASEVSQHIDDLLFELVPRYFGRSGLVRIVKGGVEQAAALLKEQFDYIFYTGNGTVGRIVMRAAAEHLTPVTLELGGKSPCIIDKTADITVAARRIVWGKFTMNTGQTCVAPDYILVVDEVKEKFIRALRTTIAEWYGESAEASKDYGRIINQRHTQRIVSLLEGQEDRIVIGGNYSIEERYIEPTVLVDVDPNSRIMQEEIFGPLLPILTISSLDEGIAFMKARPKPLACYLFSSSRANKTKVTRMCHAGGLAINEVVMHVGIDELPFGGVGESGMGAYNSKATFETFSHYKSVLDRSTMFDSSLRYPPYTRNKMRLVLASMRIKLPSTKWFFYFLAFASVAVLSGMKWYSPF